MNLKEQFNYENKHYLMLDAEKCEKIAEDFAISFAKWGGMPVVDIGIEELLEIFKKENEQT